MFSKSLEGGSINSSRSSLSLRDTSGINRKSFVVIEKKGDYTLEQYGIPLPVQVKECFQKCGDSQPSAQLNSNGWCWIVNESSLYLWRYYSPDGNINKINIRVEYPLPSVDNYRASNVVLTTSETVSQSFVFVISPQGDIRYWSTLSSDVTRYFDAKVNLTAIPLFSLPAGLNHVLCVTEDCQLYRISIEHSGHSISAMATRLDPEGLLAGLGKRVSSLFFRSEGKEIKRPLQFISYSQNTCIDFFFLLTNNSLQKWTYDVSQASQPKVLLSWDSGNLLNILKTQTANSLWPYHSDLEEFTNSLHLVLLDCAIFRDMIVILYAVSQTEVSTVLLASYVLAFSNVNGNPDFEIKGINYSTPYENNLDSLLINALSCSNTHCFISHPDYIVTWDYSSNSVQCFSFPEHSAIIGRGYSPDDYPVFLNRKYGVIRITSAVLHEMLLGNLTLQNLKAPTALTHHLSTSSTSLPTQPHSTTYSSLLQHSSIGATTEMSSDEMTEIISKLEKAMFSYVDGNLVQACIEVDDALPPHKFSSTHSTDTLADLSILELSRVIINDKPSNDPRWLEQIEEDPSGSLIIQNQLQHKLLAHETFINFVLNTTLMSRLGLVSVGSQTLPTAIALLSHQEKLIACLSIRKLHTRMTRELLSGAIKVALSIRGVTKLIGDITPQDRFYQEVEHMESILSGLVMFEIELVSKLPSNDAIKIIISVSNIMENMLHEAYQHRQKQANIFIPPPAAICPPYYDWISVGGRSSVRTALLQQLEVIMEQVQNATELDQKSLYKLMLDISDIVLSGLEKYTRLVRNAKNYQFKLGDAVLLFESTRKELVEPFMRLGQLAHATTLAEKYCDFMSLIKIYASVGNTSQLEVYMNKFKEQKFSEFLFKWYLDERRIPDLLSFSSTHSEEVEAFLEDHPQYLWMHYVSVGKYQQAHVLLKSLAELEMTFAKKKTILLSLSKLSILASEDYEGKTTDLEQIDDSLSIMSYQSHISLDVLNREGYEEDRSPPFNCRDIVEMYVNSDKNQSAGVFDFLRALELVQIVYQNDLQAEDRASLILYIWTMAVMKDDWFNLSTDDPLLQIQDTVVFQIIGRALSMSSQIVTMVLDYNTLCTSPTIQEEGLARSPQFRYLYCTGYEEFKNVINKTTALDQSVLFPCLQIN